MVFKADLLYLLGKILRQQDKLELSFHHFSLSKIIRQSEEWKLPQKLFDELKTFSFSEIPQTDLKKLKKELKKYWDSFKAQQIKMKTFNRSKTVRNNYIEGEITRLLHDNNRGKVGFIKSQEKEHYFSVSTNYHLISKIAVGTKVLFEIFITSDEYRKQQVKIKKIIQ
ncbi:hypothetical protein [Chryseobacterium sp. C3]|uniref:hypothetical protein n=1 Tax=Chryseobacterium sp. C3 TaxID=2761532 RepID=UPI00162626E3|nr:hypothetical protein [Chryseobacterium sp. C3]